MVWVLDKNADQIINASYIKRFGRDIKIYDVTGEHMTHIYNTENEAKESFERLVNWLTNGGKGVFSL